MLKARALVVLPLAALLMVGAVRAMTFVAPSDHPLRALVATFAAHPEARTDRAMAEIGAAAARGHDMPPSARQGLAAVAGQAPLAADAFLVEGTAAQMANDGDRAERLFLAARTRNPRSEGARYFLAEHYLKTGRIQAGLVEMGALARLSERASEPLVPALVAYARTPGAIAELRRFFVTAPVVRGRTLSLLAGDARNAPLILALMPESRPGAIEGDWPQRLVRSMVLAEDYSGAEAMWVRLSGVSSRGLLYNPQFRDLPGQPPFNWSYGSGSAGVAEPSRSGGLNVIYYGREDATLASQMLRLAPGHYQLAMRIDGPTRAKGVGWTIICYPGSTAILQLPLGTVNKGAISGNFAVPASGCPAQSLELRGQPPEVTETAQLRVFDLKLERLAGGS